MVNNLITTLFLLDINTSGVVAFLSVLVIAIPIIYFITKPKNTYDEVKITFFNPKIKITVTNLLITALQKYMY